MKVLYVTTTENFFRHVRPVFSEFKDELDEVQIRVESHDCRERNEKWPFPVMIRHYQSSVSGTMMMVRNLRSYFYWILYRNQNWNFLNRYLNCHRTLITPIFEQMHRSRMTRLLPPSLMISLLDRFEKNYRVPLKIFEDIKQAAPDLVIACPMIYPNSAETDYVKACQQLKVPTVGLIASWDNLTSKNIMPVIPDWVFVWNEMQAEQLRMFHLVPTARIRVVGAQLFDYMFDETTRVDREKFCQSQSLDCHRPILLWASSSRAAGVDEPRFLAELLKKMNMKTRLKNMQVLIRPHPKFLEQWNDWDAPQTQVWHRSRFPDDRDTCQGIQNSLFHVEAVLGVSTSMFFETAIADRPCAMIDILQSGQQHENIYKDFIHYEYLKSSNVFQTLESMDDCISWLETLNQGDPYQAARRRFVNSFIRPGGKLQRASTCAAAAIREILEGKNNDTK